MLKRTHISHQHLKDAKTLVEPALQSSNQRQSLPQKTGRLDKNAFLGRQPVLNRTHTSRQRLEDATEPLLVSMRPACTIDNAGPVRWMSEVSLPTSVAYNAGTLVQHRSVECQRYRCLRALPTSHCDESLVRAIDNAGTLVQHRSVSVECQRYRCLRALPTSHCDESLRTSHCDESLVRAIGPLSPRFNAAS